MKTKLGLIAAALALGVSAQADPLVSLFDGKTLDGWVPVPAGAWTIKDGSIAMTGTARGVLYTTGQYDYYRIIYSVRQVSGVNHWPCVLFFGTIGKDALAGIQFQLPKTYTWDYRAGHNNDGGAFMTHLGNIAGVTKSAWARCEILVDARNGTARGAAAQPIGTKATEIVDFKDPAIKNIPSPFGIQSHNAGQFDEYKDIWIEVNPSVNDLVTTKGVWVPPTPPVDTIYEAENAPIAGTGSVYEASNAGFTGSGYVNLGVTGGTLTFSNVNGNGGGTKSLGIRYANGSTVTRIANLVVNNVTTLLPFQPTGSWTTWRTLNVNGVLNNNAFNTIQFATTGNDAGNIDSITVPAASSFTYQAENATLTGTGSAVESTNAGFHGTGYINFGSSGSGITFSNVAGNGGGTKSLAIRYALGAATPRSVNLVVNGLTSSITFPPTGAWTTWDTLNVDVTLGNNSTNTIQFTTTGQDSGNIDEITVP